MWTSPSTFVVKRVCLANELSPGIDLEHLGYHEQALALCEKYRRHDKYIKIQTENLKEYQKALAYIEKLKFEDALQAFRNYGKSLMREEPKSTTQLLKQLRPTPQEIEQEQLPESLINLFMNHPDELLDYLDYAVKVDRQRCSLFFIRRSVLLAISSRTYSIHSLWHDSRITSAEVQSSGWEKRARSIDTEDSLSLTRYEGKSIRTEWNAARIR